MEEITDAVVDQLRFERLVEINKVPGDRADLEAKFGRVWTLTELSEEYEILGFAAPFVIVRSKSDGSKGSFEFQHSPRFYFNFTQDK